MTEQTTDAIKTDQSTSASARLVSEEDLKAAAEALADHLTGPNAGEPWRTRFIIDWTRSQFPGPDGPDPDGDGLEVQLWFAPDPSAMGTVKLVFGVRWATRTGETIVPKGEFEVFDASVIRRFLLLVWENADDVGNVLFEGGQIVNAAMKVLSERGVTPPLAAQVATIPTPDDQDERLVR